MLWTNWIKAKTLRQGVFKSYLLLGALVFVVTLATAIVVLYSIEDVFLERMLARAEQNFKTDKPLPEAIKYYSIAETPVALAQRIQTNAIADLEYIDSGKNYHARKVDFNNVQGWLVLDATDYIIINRALQEIIGIFLLAILFLAVFYWLLAKKMSQRIVRPFQFLLKQVEEPKVSSTDTQDIEYQDVKKVAVKLLQNIDEKQRLLEENILFNQGISHELRTPLQIIQNSVEIIKSNDENINSAKSIRRLQSASEQLESIVLSFLWLSSSEKFEGKSNVNSSIDDLIARQEKVTTSSSIAIKAQNNCPLNIAAPKEVIEVILSNLLQNALNHCVVPSIIEIATFEVGFSIKNDYHQNSKGSEGFGLGLSLAKRLADRFNLFLSVDDSDSEFIVRVETKANVSRS